MTMTVMVVMTVLVMMVMTVMVMTVFRRRRKRAIGREIDR